MTPNTYPIPEYRPSTPQSAAQPEMVDIVKTYSTTKKTRTATWDRSSAAKVPEEDKTGARAQRKATHRNDR
jgi:hypothetical protein